MVEDVDVDPGTRVEWAYAWAGNLHFRDPCWDDDEFCGRLGVVQRTYAGVGRAVRHVFNDTGDSGRMWVFEPDADGSRECESRWFAYDGGVTPGREVRDPRLVGADVVWHAPSIDLVADYLQEKYGLHTWVGWRNEDALDREWLVGHP